MNTHVVALAFAAAALAAAPHSGVAVSAQALTFDAASVKRNLSGDVRVRGGIQGRAYTAVNMRLDRIIATAYELGVEPRLAGGPEWIRTDRFDIAATIPENATVRQVPAMLRALLAERFRLVAHSETRETPAYALVLARSDRRLGPQLRAATIDCAAEAAAGRVVPPAKPGEKDLCFSQVDSGIHGAGQPLSSLARMLSVFAQRAVVDKTGLTGGFDFDLEIPQPSTAPGTDAGGGVFTALQEQLGLKLEPIQAPLEFIVIDSIEAPAEN